MALDVHGQSCKLLLEFFNIIFAMVGFGMVSLGLCGSQTCGFFNLDLNSQMLIIGVFAAGALMLLVAIVGHAGMYSESREALEIVSVLLVVLCAAEIGAGVLAFVNKDKVARSLSTLYKTVYMQYMNKRDQRQAIALHIFHYGLNCCGMGGPLEPFVRDTCPKKSEFWDVLNTSSCVTAISNLFDSNAPIVWGFFIGIAVLLIVACYLSHSILVNEDPRS
ncbi:CD9 antigen-like [Acipenser ruthenus]|uniref:CD9 antigen-like n=1 Tax=Acipenser ruthenus TaxID=7906 RepID=UPI002741BA26|nr:CD9 antigen-like [Acipenser ruthenus]